jgi:hypothetical protein
VSRRVAHRHADWLSLVEATGSFVTVPVLNRVFPNGVDHLDSTTRALVRQQLPADLRDVAGNTAWTEWVLTDLLRWGNRLRSGPQVPATLTHVAGEHRAVLRPDYVLVEPGETGEHPRALVCRWPYGTDLTAKLPGDRWSASPAERMSLLCRATSVPLGFVTDGNEWHVVWSPADAPPGTARFFSSLFSEEPALLDAFVSLFGAKRFFGVAAADTVEAILAESATAQEEVAEQLGKQVRFAVELLIASISRANRERDGQLLAGHTETEIYTASVTVMMRMVFLLFAEERGLLPLDEDLYARSYALGTLRESLQAERDQFGDEPLERRSTAWSRLLALFRAVHGGITHEDLRIPPYGGRLFNPDRFPFLEGRPTGTVWHQGESHPIPVDDLTVLAILTSLQVLEIREGGIREARQLSYRTLEVEQIGHVYEGLLDHSVTIVDQTMLGLIGKAGDEPEVPLNDLEQHATLGRAALIAWLKPITGKTEAQLTKILDATPSDNDRQVLTVTVENDTTLFDRLLPYIGLLRRDLRELPIVLLAGSVIVTQTSARRDGGIEYTTRSLADEVAQYALEPLVYSPGPQHTPDTEQWRLRSSLEILDLKVCDPAVGSGAILVAAGRYLADRLIEAWEAEGAQEASTSPEELLITARRAVADRCLYGVDRDPLAAEMAKLSLWLTTMSKDRPFTFLDHSIRVGDGLLGVTDLDQIRWMHLDPSQGRRVHASLFDYTGILEPLVKDALDRRRRLAAIRVLAIRDAEDKARLTSEADEDLEALRVVADLVVGATLGTATQKPSALATRLQAAASLVEGVLVADHGVVSARRALAEVRSIAVEWMNAQRPTAAPLRRCMHWPLEFPEVFLDRPHPGFDAFLGNPPYIGNKYWKERLGPELNPYFQGLMGGTLGKPDLIVLFFWRMVSLTRNAGCVASLSTQSICEVDSKKLMERTTLESATIFRAARSRQWPGNAKVVISLLWLRVGDWGGQYVLDNHQVERIGSDLREDSGLPPAQALRNSAYAFQGVDNSRGDSFILRSDSGLVLSGEYTEYVKPYLSGEDLTTGDPRRPSRFVLDLTGLSETALSELPNAIREYVEDEVRPNRTPDHLAAYEGLEKRWWTFCRTREEGFRQVRQVPTCVAIAAVSKYLVALELPSTWVFTNKVIVLPIARSDTHVVFSSSAFDLWSRLHGGSLGAGRTMKIASVVGTFPLPLREADGQYGGLYQRALYRTCDERGQAITGVLNAVHDPDERSTVITEVRGALEALNGSVLKAYGWGDLDAGMHFRTTSEGVRYSLSEAVERAVIVRLHDLNKERYEAEVAAGLHAGKRRATSKKAAALAPPGAPTLFDDEAGDDGEGDE